MTYSSWFPILGNLLFSVRTVPKLVGEEVTVEGWYFRSTSPRVGLRRLLTDEETITGYVHFGSYAWAVLVIVLGAGVLAVPAVL